MAAVQRAVSEGGYRYGDFLTAQSFHQAQPCFAALECIGMIQNQGQADPQVIVVGDV